VVPLRHAIAAFAVCATSIGSAQSGTDRVAQWRPHIAEAAARFGLPEAWVARGIPAESRGMTMLDGRPITSRAGAMGLMQLMPATWDEMRRRLSLGLNPHDPHDNIIAGAFYLRMMVDRFGYPGALAAYNAGPGRYAEHLASGRALPGETVAYLATAGAAVPAVPGPRAQTIFIALGGRSATAHNRIVHPLFAIQMAAPADAK
jgi:soluble lytic murein transglycosylase-like protein